ncbi:4Fe-4S dicluster domain-containing protein, partial [Thermodesulfobacteriota bacterium]
ITVIFSKKIFTLIKIFILDVIFQRRALKEDILRWAMHMLIYSGFMLLILMHALGEIITASLFNDYYSTLNPFFFLRDLFGLIVILGVLIAVSRRFLFKKPRFKTSGMDIYAIIIVAAIILSGILLEGIKITSYSDFARMVEDYAGLDMEDDIEEIIPLESLWVKDFGLVSPNVSGPFDEDVLELGFENHEMSCMSCHSSPKWAFTGYASAKAISFAALSLDRSGISEILYYIHIIACFIGLAILPFTKMFHIISTPLNLLANSVMDKDHSLPENIATRQVLELDACVHCGTCSRFCSAMMGYEARENPYILPSEKMALLKRFSWGKEPGENAFKAIQEGVYLCTNCDRCTVVCPSGINLKELWISVREGIIQKGIPEPLMLSPLSLVRSLNRKTLPDSDYSHPLRKVRKALSGSFDSLNDPEQPISLPLADEHDDSNMKIMDDTFSYCFGCQNCTTVCPVVDNYENPQETLGLLPHQIMRCLGLGLEEMASGPDMLWDCVTCYQCQEHCPQKVKVADILYDLKNMAVKNLDHKKLTDKIEAKV